jgi:hypothetical protein
MSLMIVGVQKSAGVAGGHPRASAATTVGPLAVEMMIRPPHAICLIVVVAFALYPYLHTCAQILPVGRLRPHESRGRL